MICYLFSFTTMTTITITMTTPNQSFSDIIEHNLITNKYIYIYIYIQFLNLYLTYLFIKPLTNVKCTSVRTNWKATRLYKLTKRTLIASLVCLLVSLANVLSVVITRGHLRGLICMTCCTLDVTINVATIHWVNIFFLSWSQMISIYSTHSKMLRNQNKRIIIINTIATFVLGYYIKGQDVCSSYRYSE